MKSILLLFLLILTSNAVNAQVIFDSDYELTYLKKIGSYYYVTKVYIGTDSVLTVDMLDTKKTLGEAKLDFDNIDTSSIKEDTDNKIIKDYFLTDIRNNKIYENRHADKNNIAVVDDFITPLFTLKDSVKIINNTKVKLAECNYYGRNYLIWYNPEIPITNGPWRFHGVPGLILSITSSDNDIFLYLIDVKLEKETHKIDRVNFEMKDAISLENFIYRSTHVNEILKKRFESKYSDKEGKARTIIQIPSGYDVDFEIDDMPIKRSN